MKKRHLLSLAVAAAGCAGGLASPRALSAPGTVRAVAAPELCVSAGRVDATAASPLHVDSGGMRAIVAGDESAVAELDFTYRGPSTETVPLASGELRRQIGLKLRAKDTCNVVYVMWHVAKPGGIAVSVKQNPGQSTHEACADRGYVNVRPDSTPVAPVLRPNERHVHRAEIAGTTLRVLVDGTPAWTGALPSQAFTFTGPAGVRSDNGKFDFDLRVLQPRAAGARCH
jgi:hypothetical protein